MGHLQVGWLIYFPKWGKSINWNCPGEHSVHRAQLGCVPLLLQHIDTNQLKMEKGTETEKMNREHPGQTGKGKENKGHKSCDCRSCEEGRGCWAYWLRQEGFTWIGSEYQGICLVAVNSFPITVLCWAVVGHFSHVWIFVTLWTIARQAPRHWDSPGKNTEVGCHFLLQGIFLTQGSNPHLTSSCTGRRILYHKGHLESSQPLCVCEWVCVCVNNIFPYGHPWGLSGEESAGNARDEGSIPKSGRYPREGNSNPIQYSCQRSLVGYSPRVARIGHILPTKQQRIGLVYTDLYFIQ